MVIPTTSAFAAGTMQIEYAIWEWRSSKHIAPISRSTAAGSTASIELSSTIALPPGANVGPSLPSKKQTAPQGEGREMRGRACARIKSGHFMRLRLGSRCLESLLERRVELLLKRFESFVGNFHRHFGKTRALGKEVVKARSSKLALDFNHFLC